MDVNTIKSFVSKRYIYVILIILLVASIFYNAKLMKEINLYLGPKDIVGTYLYGVPEIDIDNAEYFTFMEKDNVYYRWKQFIMLEKGVYKEEGDVIYLLSKNNVGEKKNYIVLSNKKLYYFDTKKNSVLGYKKISDTSMFINVKPQEDGNKPITLSESEMAYFNGDLFFNGDDFNIRNQFLSSLYDKPEDINLFELFYSSSIGEEITENKTKDTEVKEVMEKMEIEGSVNDLQCGCDKITHSEIDQILTKYLGIKLNNTNKIGLESFVYLSQYDAYYIIHGDTNYRVNITFSNGEKDGDIVRLYYNDKFSADGDKVLTLQEQDGEYKFVSNQKL